MPPFRPDTPDSGALFSPEEVRRLMIAEFDRAQRFGSPMALIQIDVDRLGYLHDLYGEEARLEILTQVNGLLRSSTRSGRISLRATWRRSSTSSATQASPVRVAYRSTLSLLFQ